MIGQQMIAEIRLGDHAELDASVRENDRSRRPHAHAFSPFRWLSHPFSMIGTIILSRIRLLP
jgi:hypothetical protein